MQILLVKDHRDGALVMSNNLRTKGFEVEIAGDCKGATRAFEAACFDLVIVDLLLPDGDGCDLLPILAQMRPVPSIALSEHPLSQDLNRIQAAGFDRYLCKPISTQGICRIIDELCPSATFRTPSDLPSEIDARIIAWICGNEQVC